MYLEEKLIGGVQWLVTDDPARYPEALADKSFDNTGRKYIQCLTAAD
jgi:hypothetical protein